MARPGAPQGSSSSAGEEQVVRILLVDDVLPFIELQKAYLKRTTCRIVTARTGPIWSSSTRRCR